MNQPIWKDFARIVATGGKKKKGRRRRRKREWKISDDNFSPVDLISCKEDGDLAFQKTSLKIKGYQWDWSSYDVVSEDSSPSLMILLKNMWIVFFEVINPIIFAFAKFGNFSHHTHKISGWCCCDANTADFVKMDELCMQLWAIMVCNMAKSIFGYFKLCVVEVVSRFVQFQFVAVNSCNIKIWARWNQNKWRRWPISIFKYHYEIGTIVLCS